MSEKLSPVARRTWPKLLAIGLTVLSLSAYFARRQWHPQPPTIGKQGSLPDQTHDFGTVLAGSESSYTFAVQNSLGRRLYIDHVSKSCGCTEASVSPTVIDPNQVFNVNTTMLMPDNLENKSALVEIDGHTDDGRAIEADCELLANVKELLQFPQDDGSIDLGSWSNAEFPATANITISRGAFPLPYDGVQVICTSPTVTATILPLDANTWRADFSIKSSNALGTNGYPVQFRLSANGKLLDPVIVKQAYVETFGPVGALPSSVLLTAAPGQRLTQEIEVVSHANPGSNVAIQITGVSVDSKNAAATFENGPGKNLVILNYTAPKGQNEDRGQIFVSVLCGGTSYKLRVGYLAMIGER